MTPLTADIYLRMARHYQGEVDKRKKFKAQLDRYVYDVWFGSGMSQREIGEAIGSDRSAVAWSIKRERQRRGE